MAFEYKELTSTAQAAYAQLIDAALTAEHMRTVADLTGSFSSKTVKGHKYWYFQYTEPSGKLRQIYIGPDNDAVKSLIELKAQPGVTQNLVPLAASAVALGCAAILPKHLRVIARLSEYGFFRAGGVLVGTHAFLAYGNMLGVQWGDSSRTQDLDFAHSGKNIALALPSNLEVNTHSAIESLQMGLLPISGLKGKTGATYLEPRDPSFRLDFLTTLHRGGEKNYEHPQLHVTLQPLKFMEYSLVQVQQAVLFNMEGAVVVNIPHPARYALHKLIVYGEREGMYASIASKDLTQAASLLRYFKDNRTWEIREAYEDLMSRGIGWVSRFERAQKAIEKAYPEIEVGKLLRE
ncbi:MAG: hypothetical protein A3H31_05335 [Gallionellales bacterium RIFCSPLOWO2_02_FULL_57_47]|nr:MAG: hypothetical protein A3H31_05335 [Gallionellales bacterium RIFCSPLOWO2_02_FULL_57_47]OGT13555.1 MAG: hypothetical protein A3J49_02340 [Gallionellales bacterium RIFCSPHIGHO2_02_FULL_57_16]